MANMIREKGRQAIRAFLANEAAGGVSLILAAAFAMLVANLSATAPAYFDLLHMETGPDLGHGPMTVHLWINDGLMAIFFLLVGLEIKREFLDGQLARWDRRRLPIVTAAAGMIVPAFVYLLITGAGPVLQRGWAIPAATDIAFALGVLALVGKGVPAPIKLFLTTVAIVDDMGAVAIIALVYTAHLNFIALGGAALVLAAMFVLNRMRVMRLWPYLILAAALWYLVFLSGVHATIAGVLAAMAIPLVPTPAAPDAAHSPLHRLEHGLSGWVAFFIVPLFGFANAGVSLKGMTPAVLLEPLPLAVALGLFIGKQIGIFGAIWLAVRTGFAKQLRASWAQIYGMSVLAGIGFTMSLFIGGLAFPGSPELVDQVKIGVLVGSLFSAILGYVVLRAASTATPKIANPPSASSEPTQPVDVQP